MQRHVRPPDRRSRPAGRRGTDARCRPSCRHRLLGGDEFVILLSPAESDENVITVGDRVAAALAQPDEYEGTLLTVTASVGVAISEPGTEVSHGLLLHFADLAVYEAKACGGATCRVHRPLVAALPTVAGNGRRECLPRSFSSNAFGSTGLTFDVTPG
jgi:predicted signal transduction protein with EAL and GGDEF domain